jgi:uncharacterized protein YjdB
MRRGLPLVALLASACSTPAKIDVDPEKPVLTGAKDPLQLRGIVRDKSGGVIGTATVTWTSLTPTIATIDPNGNVQAVTSGTATMLARSGKVSRSVEVLVQIPKKIRFEPDSPMLMQGVTKGFKATVLNDRDQAMFVGELRWSTSDPEIFTVDGNGNVKTIKEGKATLTVHAAGISGSNPITVKHEELHEDGTLSQ